MNCFCSPKTGKRGLAFNVSSNAMLWVEGWLELREVVEQETGEEKERGDRVGNYNDYPRSAITWMTKRRVIQ